jgi:hypothetical protein
VAFVITIGLLLPILVPRSGGYFIIAGSSPSYLNGLGGISPNSKAGKQGAVELRVEVASTLLNILRAVASSDQPGKDNLNLMAGPGSIVDPETKEVSKVLKMVFPEMSLVKVVDAR